VSGSNGREHWDRSVHEASEVYKERMVSCSGTTGSTAFNAVVLMSKSWRKAITSSPVVDEERIGPGDW